MASQVGTLEHKAWPWCIVEAASQQRRATHPSKQRECQQLAVQKRGAADGCIPNQAAPRRPRQLRRVLPRLGRERGIQARVCGAQDPPAPDMQWWYTCAGSDTLAQLQKQGARRASVNLAQPAATLAVALGQSSCTRLVTPGSEERT